MRTRAQSLGLTLYRIAGDAMPAQTADHETFVRLWQRESALLPIALYIDAAQVERTAKSAHGSRSAAGQRAPAA